MKTIYLTEQQVEQLKLIESSQVLSESFRNIKNTKEMKKKIKSYLKKGVSVAILVSALITSHKMGYNEAMGIVGAVYEELTEEPKNDVNNTWELIADDVFATVYNAVPNQCNNDITHTASMFRLNLKDVLSHRIIAMERTMMAEFGLKYGDVVKIEGTGKWDGEWQIQDTMNKRFAGQHKIDILIPKSAGLGKWNDVKVYRLSNPEAKEEFKSQMAPQLSKADATKQIQDIKNGNFQTV